MSATDCFLIENFNQLHEETSAYLGCEICEIEPCVEPLDFYRDYVSKNLPVIIRNGVSRWPALCKWNPQFFKQCMPDKKVTVSLTPNGINSGIAKNDDCCEYFVTPFEIKMTMATFIDHLESKSDKLVPCITRQSICLELRELIKDIEPDVPYATTSFNRQPDCVYFCMYDGRATTSMHKDLYENFFCVVDGCMDFMMVPPTDLPFIPHQRYPQAQYQLQCGGIWDMCPVDPARTGAGCYKAKSSVSFENNGGGGNYCGGSVCPAAGEVFAVAVDPQCPDYSKFPEFKCAHKFQARLNKGDCLYVPSLWFHHITQSHAAIAVNYLYDMDYDIKYCYYKLLERLCHKV